MKKFWAVSGIASSLAVSALMHSSSEADASSSKSGKYVAYMVASSATFRLQNNRPFLTQTIQVYPATNTAKAICYTAVERQWGAKIRLLPYPGLASAITNKKGQAVIQGFLKDDPLASSRKPGWFAVCTIGEKVFHDDPNMAPGLLVSP